MFSGKSRYTSRGGTHLELWRYLISFARVFRERLSKHDGNRMLVRFKEVCRTSLPVLSQPANPVCNLSAVLDFCLSTLRFNHMSRHLSHQSSPVSNDFETTTIASRNRNAALGTVSSQYTIISTHTMPFTTCLTPVHELYI